MLLQEVDNHMLFARWGAIAATPSSADREAAGRATFESLLVNSLLCVLALAFTLDRQSLYCIVTRGAELVNYVASMCASLFIWGTFIST